MAIRSSKERFHGAGEQVHTPGGKLEIEGFDVSKLLGDSSHVDVSTS